MSDLIYYLVVEAWWPLITLLVIVYGVMGMFTLTFAKQLTPQSSRPDELGVFVFWPIILFVIAVMVSARIAQLVATRRQVFSRLLRVLCWPAQVGHVAGAWLSRSLLSEPPNATH